MEWISNNTNETFRMLFKNFCDKDYISILKAQLKQAETTEDYELCCELRDERNELLTEQN